MVCQDSSGCHMWCAPVWSSFKDTLDWGEMATQCSNWDGGAKPDDATCVQASRVYTWARTMVPSTAASMRMVFAILGEVCEQFCTGLQVTVYDVQDWSKSFRWCFNHRGIEVNHNHASEMSHCDVVEDVPLGVWRERDFHFLTNFTGKYDHDPLQLAMELAVYNEFGGSEVLLESLHFSHRPTQLLVSGTDSIDPASREMPQVTDDKIAAQIIAEALVTPVPSSAEDTLHCGVVHACPEGSRCCRGRTDECCPLNFQCCGDLCCPHHFTCNLPPTSDDKLPTFHLTPTCTPPATPMPPVRPALCSLGQ